MITMAEPVLTKDDIKLLKEERAHLRKMINKYYRKAPFTAAMSEARIRDINDLLDGR